jgi:hypothetical protein
MPLVASDSVIGFPLVIGYLSIARCRVRQGQRRHQSQSRF